MTTLLQLKRWEDWLQPGSPDDSRLLHSDPSDYISVCRPQFGQGYIQSIPLRDDLWINILDYTLTDDLVMDAAVAGNHLEFEFPLTGALAGYSFFIPNFGFKGLTIWRAQQRVFKVEVFFRWSTLISYFQAFIARLSPHAGSVAERMIQAMYRHQSGGSLSTPDRMLSRVMQGEIAARSHTTLDQVVPDTLYKEAIALKYATRTPIKPATNQVIGQVLGCPYGGKTRRAYLERQALKLVSLHLAAMEQPHPSETELNSVEQAASILRNQLSHPPSIEALARQVCTNRLKLNQGFRAVYGTTPYGYLRDCRLFQAQRLLATSDMAIADIATSVGYTNRSHFALAFRQWTGLNPKTFQLQAWHWVS